MATPSKSITDIKKIPRKRSPLPLAILSILIVIGLVAVLVSVVSGMGKNNNKPKPITSISPSPKPNISISPSPSLPGNTTSPGVPGPSTTPVDGVPETQVVYYGKVDNKMGFFITDRDIQRQSTGGRFGYNVYMGQIFYEDGTFDMDFDFRQMKEAKVVMRTEYTLAVGILPAISNYKLNNKTGMLYIVINTVGNRPTASVNIAQVLYRVDLYYGRVKQLMTNQIGVTFRTLGDMTIEEIWRDEYLLLKAGSCINCDNKEPYEWLVLNTDLRTFRLIGPAADVREDRNASTIVYRKTVAVKEPCGAGDINCDEQNEKTVYKIAPKTYTMKLP